MTSKNWWLLIEAAVSSWRHCQDRFVSSKFCIVRYTSVKTKRSKSTQIPKLISSLTAWPKLVSIVLYQKFKLDHSITQLKSFIGSHYDIRERTPYFTNIVCLCTNSRGGFTVILFQCSVFWFNRKKNNYSTRACWIWDYYGSFLSAEIEITILSPVVLQEWSCGYYIS